MIPDSSNDPTRKIDRETTDPVEIARRHRDDPPDPTYLPESIGPYKILEQLGSGGMGLVYLAQQSAPDRVVAIKITPPGRRTKEILARFEIEREALAMMDHPNIAKVFDAGESGDGRPYFVMEYVRGISITDYCDKNKLNTDERLSLFMEVCRAVHHAHQKGIIHRDIKPGNVLVGVQENRPIAKVIDFGVAKALGHRLTLRTVFTEKGQLIGTPGYMSPEQAEMSALDIDTRTDIYSLGVLLYELLVGAQPFDTHKLMEAGFQEIQRVICEVDPPKPSTRLSSLGEGDSTVVASNRRTAVRSLTRELRGDLDWITMKCLEKDRVRRYDSASALAEDVERHMRGLPVLAGPPSAAYKMRKFVRRHRFGVAAGLTIAAALIAGFVGTAIQYYQKEAQRIRADYEAETARQVNDLFIDMLRVSDPSEAQGNKVLARDVLDRAAARIPHELSSRPQVQAAMMDAIGSVYANLGLYSEAERLFRGAMAIYRREVPEGSPDMAPVLHHLGALMDMQSRYDEGEIHHKEGLALAEKHFGHEHIETSDSLVFLATHASYRQQTDEAEQMFQDALNIRRKLLPAQDVRIAEVQLELGREAHGRSDWTLAAEYYAEALKSFRTQRGELHPNTIDAEFFLADIAYKRNKLSDSIKMHEAVLEKFRTIYGRESSRVAASMNMLAMVLVAKGDAANAIGLAEQALAINTKLFGDVHPQIASDLNLMGVILRKLGRLDEAVPYHQRSLDMRIELARRAGVSPDDDEMIAVTRVSFGTYLSQIQRYEDAEREFLKAIATYHSNARIQWRLRGAYEGIIELYKNWGKPQEEAKYRDLLEVLIKTEAGKGS